jgi:hypothetical protein
MFLVLDIYSILLLKNTLSIYISISSNKGNKVTRMKSLTNFVTLVTSITFINKSLTPVPGLCIVSLSKGKNDYENCF